MVDTQALSALVTPYTITYSYGGDANFLSASDDSTTLTVNKATPVITWANPAEITYGTALSSTQLDAVASVPGTPSYSPASGKVLDAATSC